MPDGDLPAERPELRGQRVGDGRRAAADHRPADGMGVHPEDQPERRRQRPRPAAASSARRGRRTGPAAPSPRNRARASAGRRAQGRQPEAGQGQRVARHVDDGPQQLAATACPRRALSGPNRRAPGPRVVGRRRGRRRRRHRPLQDDRARPASSAWATGASGWMSSTPCAAQSTVRKNGEATVSGTIVEHTSWRNPGRVSSWVRVPPPIVGAAS